MTLHCFLYFEIVCLFQLPRLIIDHFLNSIVENCDLKVEDALNDTLIPSAIFLAPPNRK